MTNDTEPVRSHHELMRVAASSDPEPNPAMAPAPPAGQAKPNSILHTALGPITREQRLQMIAEAAYFMAEHRGFEPGHETEDWLAAETEVDTLVSGSHEL